MLDEQIKQYIQSYFLRASEEIDDHQLFIYENGLVEVPIVKRTARRRRKTRELLLQLDCTVESSELEKISKLFASPAVKKKWSAIEGDSYVHSGLLMKVMDYENDEKSVKSITYVMGLPLFKYKEKQAKRKEEEQQQALSHLKLRYEEIVHSSTYKNPSDDRRTYMEIVVHLFDERFNVLTNSGHIDDKNELLYQWRFSKQIVFLHFLLAFYQLMQSREQFDWKEIGAHYYSEIGGSKKFDLYKRDFLEMFEILDFPPLSLAGLKSFGSIAYIPFSGLLEGKWSQYDYGTIHSVTDHEVFADSFKTNAETLWLVENRGVLTRFTYEKDFLRKTDSIMIGVEGQLRSAVKRFISMVFQNSSIKQVIIWTDYDEAGVIIANTIYELLDKEKVIIKWIGPGENRVITDVDHYQRKLDYFLQSRSSEQEEDMGGPDEWLTWIQH